MPSSTSDVCLYFIAIFLPFLPVLIRRGCGADLLINICLDILGWIPGVGGLLASLKSAPEAWAEQTAGGRIKVVHLKRWDEVMGWEMRNGGRRYTTASNDSD
ncbi:plasma membrane proteolipid Pmp3 [Didymella heteroderae]|uniref:Plasma membrane proteolipid Pmp3 n=1 Tax=Didymella heteroderae TaxID=1769908 RepID=A0A9P4WQ09_9PLEO|nr:plasma membrane proteolipid Pmp3 [Didymella heteroderae]